MPNRILKESICYSDDLDRLSPFAETVFYRLMVRCDDYGRIDARPGFLKSTLFVTKKGITEKNVEDAVSQLASVGLVRRYEVAGKPFLLFPKWSLHQRIRNSREKYPEPENGGGENERAASCGSSPQTAAIIQSETESETEYGSVSESEPAPMERSRAGKPADRGSTPLASTMPMERSRGGKPEARVRGRYGYVKLTDGEYERLIADLGEGEAFRVVAYVDESAQATGNKNRWKDWNLVLRKAAREGWGMGRQAQQPDKLGHLRRMLEEEERREKSGDH
ncbi:MAG: hypothetical protein AAGU74_08190 [Bacillota bacterium]